MTTKDTEERDFDSWTRQVMGEINATHPGRRLAEVPTLFAFGPINRALKEAFDAGRREATPEKDVEIQEANRNIGELLQAVSARTSERDQARDAIKVLEQTAAEERERCLLVDRDADLRRELQTYLDTLTITSENIGDIRRSCFVPWDSQWNGWVRDETAARENKAMKGTV